MCKRVTPEPPEANTSFTGSPGGLTPGKSYAEALTGSPSPGLPRDRSTGDVNPNRSVISDTLSIQEEQSDTNGNSNEPIRLFDTNQQSTPSQTEPSTNTTNTNRQRWTKDEQIDIVKCYYEALRKGLPLTKGTFNIWREKYPLRRPNMNPVTLSNQRRYAEKKVFTMMEMRTMKASVEEGTTQMTEETHREDTPNEEPAPPEDEPTDDVI